MLPSQPAARHQEWRERRQRAAAAAEQRQQPEEQALRAYHRLRGHRVEPGLRLLGAREAEPLRQHRVAPLQVWAGPAAAGHRPQQRPHQDLGCLHR